MSGSEAKKETGNSVENGVYPADENFDVRASTYTSYCQDSGPFGNFLAVALSTLLTILLAWRVLFEDENSIIAPDAASSKPPLKKLRDSECGVNNSHAKSSTHGAARLSVGSGASSLGSLLASSTTPVGMALLDESYDSDVSTSEDPDRPLFLDTITEEDTDDLKSLESSDDLRSPSTRPPPPPKVTSVLGPGSVSFRPLSISVVPNGHAVCDNAVYDKSVTDGRADRYHAFHHHIQHREMNGKDHNAYADNPADRAHVTETLNGLNGAVQIGKKSPSEERFLKAYQSYVSAVSGLIGSTSAASSTTTLSDYEDSLHQQHSTTTTVKPDFDNNCAQYTNTAAADSTTGGIICGTGSMDLDALQKSHVKFQNYSKIYADAPTTDIADDSLTQEPDRYDYQEADEITPPLDNADLLLNNDTTSPVHTLSHSDCSLSYSWHHLDKPANVSPVQPPQQQASSLAPRLSPFHDLPANNTFTSQPAQPDRTLSPKPVNSSERRVTFSPRPPLNVPPYIPNSPPSASKDEIGVAKDYSAKESLTGRQFSHNDLDPMATRESYNYFKPGQPQRYSSSAAGGEEEYSSAVKSGGLKYNTTDSSSGGKNLNSSSTAIPVAQVLRHIDVTTFDDSTRALSPRHYSPQVRQISNSPTAPSIKSNSPGNSPGKNNGPIFGNNYQLPKVIASVQYKPPGVSIKHQQRHLASPDSLSNSSQQHRPNFPYPAGSNVSPNSGAGNSWGSETHSPTRPTEPVDRSIPAPVMSSTRRPYVSSRATERYEHFERTVEVIHSYPDTNDNIYSKDYGPIYDVRTKPVMPRGKIPWATASVFPASTPEQRDDMPSKPDRWSSSRPELTSPSRVTVTSFDSGKVTPIDPPSEFRQLNIERSTVKPKLIGDQYCSSDALQKMIQGYSAADADDSVGYVGNHASSERQRSRPESRSSVNPESGVGGRTPRWQRSGSWHQSSAKDTSSNVADRGSAPSKDLATSDRTKSKESIPEVKKSKETLFPVTPPGSTGKPTATEPKTYPTEKGEPPKRPVPLNERNLEWWTSLPQNQPDSSSNLMRWRHSINLSDEQLDDLGFTKAKEESPQKVNRMDRRDPAVTPVAPELTAEFENFKRSMPKMSDLLDDHAIERNPEPRPIDAAPFRRPQSQGAPEAERSFEERQSLRNRYKAKIDKAKRNFIEGDNKASVGDLSKPKEEFENKHAVSLDKFMRKPAVPRGPLLEKFSDPLFKSNVDIRYRAVRPNYKTPEPLWDDEYKKLVAKAESVWMEYRKKSNPNLYRNNKSHSMGYLETDLDSGRRATDANGRPHETNLDDIHLSGHIPSDQQRGRSRAKSGADFPPAGVESSHSRAKSMDYLVDGRDKIEPPENELQKTVARILGKPVDSHTPSEHELRFKKSLEKLHVPNWYLESDYVGKPGNMDRGRSERRTMPSVSSRATTPGYGYADRHDLSESTTAGDISYTSAFNSRPPSTAPNPPPVQAPYRAPKDYNIPSQDTRYSKPWSYIDDSKISGASPSDKNSGAPVKRSTPSSTSAAPASSLGPTSYPRGYRPTPGADRPTAAMVHTQKHDAPEPVRYQPDRRSSDPRPQKPQGSTQDIFNRYKDEINELWNSRKSLRQSQSSLHELEHASRTYEAPSQQTRQGSVPVAAVKPRLQGYGPTPSPPSQHGKDQQWNGARPERPTDLDLPPAYPAPPPPKEEFNDVLQTSTPVSSGHLPRKQYPERETIRPSPPSDGSPGWNSRSHDSKIKPSRAPPPPPPQSAQDPKYDRHAPQSVPRPYAKAYHGYTVAPVPNGLDQPRTRASKIVEVADLGAGPVDSSSGQQRPVASHVTLEEVLDSLLGLPGRGTGKVPITPAPSSHPPSLPPAGQPIFTANHDAMLLAATHPHKAQEILKKEKLFVRCQYCGNVSPLQQAWSGYVTCRYCYTYYCGRECRRADWNHHADACSFSRVSTLCKEVIMKVRMDKEAQYRMSKVARAGYSERGRGSVNFRFRHAHFATLYLEQGFAALARVQPECLFYYTIQDLSSDNKDKQLIASCRRYKPSEKFVLSVSIIADCDVVPETPLSMRRSATDDSVVRHGQDRTAFVNRAQSLPPKAVKRTAARQAHPENVGDAKILLKSILRSMENIAPGPPELVDPRNGRITPSSSFGGPDIQCMDAGRHSVSGFNRTPSLHSAYSNNFDQFSLHSQKNGRISRQGTESFV